MSLHNNQQYSDSLRRVEEHFPHWAQLEGRTLLFTGASGMIGSFLVDMIMQRNRSLPTERRCRIIAMGRSTRQAEARFAPWWEDACFRFCTQDVTEPLAQLPREPDYLIHGASTTHPQAYATQPVNTILANVFGTKNLLDTAAQYPGCRFLLLSSVEIYGENRGDTEAFAEDYCGYLNCNTLRGGYPAGKRVSEALCQAYIQEKGVDARILRLPRIYGPTMQATDTKAAAQFLQKGAAGEDIVLKSEGRQLYSYLHTADAVSAVLWVLTRGEAGQAYNAGDPSSDILLRDLAQLIAEYAGTKVVFQLPDEVERKGYSPVTRALMDASRLRALGWTPIYDIKQGLEETLDILRERAGC